MKIRHLYRLNRLLLPCAAIVLGVLAGYFVGKESILDAVKSRIGDYANRIGERNEEVGSEITRILAAADAAHTAPCSDQDIALLRRLTFSARFLKDVGRLGSNRLLCSATLGKLAAPPTLLKPDMDVLSGFRIYLGYPLQSPVGVHAVVVATKTADVVLSPDLYYEFSQEPIRFAIGVPSIAGSALAPNPSSPGPSASAITAQDPPLFGSGASTAIPPAVFGAKLPLEIGDAIYAGRCSALYGVCAATSIHSAEIWKNNEGLFLGYIGTGGAAGILCATALLMAGRRRGSPAKQLRRAIGTGKLGVTYQPIIELGTHRIVGAEALARWVDEDGDRIRPERILALAESEGFASEVTRLVLSRAVAEIAPLLETNPAFRLSINLAPSDIADAGLISFLDEELDRERIAPASITFELSERATANREVAVASIRTLREKGYAIFIDDFGSGYSNLAYLTELHVDGIKISRAFTGTVGTESVTASIVPQILAVAKALNLSVVVRGIEREDQARYFASDDPSILGQGWFFGLPIQFKELAQKCAETPS